MSKELELKDDAYLRISYGLTGSFITILVVIGIWVGTHAARLSNAEARIDRQKEWISDTNNKVDKKFEVLEGRVYQIWTETVPAEKRKQLPPREPQE